MYIAEIKVLEIRDLEKKPVDRYNIRNDSDQPKKETVHRTEAKLTADTLEQLQEKVTSYMGLV